MRSESGGVSFPFQSFLDSGESAVGRMPDTVHPLSGKRVEFEYDENVGSEFVNWSSFRRQFQCLITVTNCVPGKLWLFK